jgi:MFS family permease
MRTVFTSGAARHITMLLFVSQSIGSAALIANATVNPIVGATLSGRDALAGLPGTLLLLGAASTAYPSGRLMERFGRRRGLALGFGVGSAGMIIGGAAILFHSFAGFLLGLLLIGAARGAVDQSRYAAADAHLPQHRAQAISTVVFAGTIGAIVGPALVAPSGALLAAFGVAPLAGPMWTGALFFALAGALLFQFLRPDPRDIARSMATDHDLRARSAEAARPMRVIMRVPAAWLALAAMLIGQTVMVLLMTVTSLHMHHHDHGLGSVSLVIMAHTLGMFGLSIFNGALTDRIGRRAAIGAGALLLIIGSAVAPISPAPPALALALFLIGLGWNLCYVAGSSLLADLLSPSERMRIQGANELVINLAAATSSLSSGVILATLGYTTLSVVGAILATIPLVMLWAERRPRLDPTAERAAPVAPLERPSDVR